MFILISAWRRSEGVTKETDPRKRVQARMAVAMQEAALSITITSLTGMKCVYRCYDNIISNLLKTEVKCIQTYNTDV